MGFRTDSYGKIWKIENKGRYSVVEMSTSKKNKQTDQYETDFSSKFVRFIGTAHEQAQTLKGDERIKITSCEVTNHYDKEKQREYVNFLVYAFELANGSKPAPKQDKNDGFMNIPDGIDEELPFA